MDVRSELSSIMTGRENLYRLLSIIFKKEVDKDFLEQLKKMEFPEEGLEEELTNGYKSLNVFLKNTNEETITELAVDFAKTFLAAGSSQGSAAFPYESVHTSLKKIIMQESWAEVCSIYEKHGFKIENADSEIMEDHISSELQFMAFLSNKTKKSKDIVSLLDEQEHFLKNHLLNWIPEFCKQIDSYSETLFYKAVADITVGFIKLDEEIIKDLKNNINEKLSSKKSYSLSYEEMDKILDELKENYNIYAPKLFKGSELNGNSEKIQYAEIYSVKEIIFDRQSDGSPKEIYYPITQTMFYFTEKDCIEKLIEDEKDIIIFARACDINAMNRLDTIFLENGGHEDLYYKRMREKVKMVLIECTESFEECFCVSLGTNKTNDYNMAVRFNDDNILIEIKDVMLESYFIKEKEADFSPVFITENKKKLEIPQIKDKQMLKSISELKFWEQFNDKCIGCGSCNTVCGSCSCFDTIDIIYKEGSKKGERRRIWSSCMLNDFTKTAGGNKARKTHGEDMRFKVMHKFYDYNIRFGGDEHMCVGCGRCVRKCPQEISFIETINVLNEEIKNLSYDA